MQAVTAIVNVCVQLLCRVLKILFCYAHPLPLALLLFLPSLHGDTWAFWGRERDINVPFKAKHSTVSNHLSVDQLSVSVLITMYSKKELLWWVLKAVLIYGYKDTNLGISLLLCPFSRIIVCDTLSNRTYNIVIHRAWGPVNDTRSGFLLPE